MIHVELVMNKVALGQVFWAVVTHPNHHSTSAQYSSATAVMMFDKQNQPACYLYHGPYLDSWLGSLSNEVNLTCRSNSLLQTYVIMSLFTSEVQKYCLKFFYSVTI
jgi:hypothetical protein